MSRHLDTSGVFIVPYDLNEMGSKGQKGGKKAPKSAPKGSKTGQKGPETEDSAPEPPETETRLVVRCTRDYHDWVAGLADHLGGLNLSQTVDQGFRRIADLAGYSQPPRRRALVIDPDAYHPPHDD